MLPNMGPQHHMTYAHAKLEVALSNGLGEDAFTKKNTIFDLDSDLKIK